MAETVLSFGVVKLWYLLAREFESFQGFNEQFDELNRDLNLLRSFLEDADAKKHTNKMVKTCVEEIKEIVFDAEDIIETFLLKKELGQTSGIRKRMSRLSYIVVDRWKIGSDIGGISKRISKVIRYMQGFGVQQMIADDRGYSLPLQERQRKRKMQNTPVSDNKDHLVGLEENVKKLVGILVEEDSFQVVSITGLGGIGKTTLAQQVINHEMVKNHFDGIAWVYTSQKVTRASVWQAILQQLRPEYKGLRMTEVQLQEKLFLVLGTRKTLIVLDDIWREEDWDIIKPIFPPGKGWKLLLTSRNEGVALQADPNGLHIRPEFLTLEESWRLFQSILSSRENTDEFKDDELQEEIGKQVIKCCGGLPLAIKVLGGLLAAEKTILGWKRLYDIITSHMVGGISFNEGNINSVYLALYLSFEELPFYLKHFFLYLAHFPEAYPIDVEKLSYYLAAEGIPNPEHYERASIREIVDGYMEELVTRNMVISERDKLTSRFINCRLNDMMREVCLSKANEEHFVHNLYISNSQSSFKSRRIAVQELEETYHPKWNRHLRSLLFIKQSPMIGWMASNLCFKRLKLLRILDLAYAKFEGGRLPSDIGLLIHLRYLSLYLAKVTHLPSSMRNLRKLLYLNLCVAAGSPIYMPNIFKKMRELRYLSLPDDMQDKTKLELGNLTNLETFENFSTKHSSVEDLHSMTRLRTLSILLNGEGCTMETLSSLGVLGHLENLTMRNHKSDKKEDILDCIHRNQLKLIQVEQHFPSHLTTISLRHTCLTEDPMPILEKLRHLKEVYLGERSFCGRKMACSGSGFPQLQKLVMKKLLQLEEWKVEKGSMPCLHSLSIHYCDRLKEVPDGLRFITSLKELTIIIIDKEFKKKLSKGGEDFYKVEHIPLLKVYGYIKI